MEQRLNFQAHNRSFVMQDKRTKKQLIEELSVLHQQIDDLKKFMILFGPEEDVFEVIGNSIQAGIYIIQDGKTIFVNEHMSSYSGYSREELLNLSLMQDTVHPEDQTQVREWGIKMLKGEDLAPYEYRILCKDGSIKWLMEKVASIKYRGQRAVLGNTMDVTDKKRTEDELRDIKAKLEIRIQERTSALSATNEALKESEERYRSLTNNIPDIIYSLDKMGNVLAVNERAVSRYGYEAEMIVGKPFLDIIHPDDREMVVNSFLQAMKDHREYTRGFQFRVQSKDGPVRWVELNSHMRFDEKGTYLQEEGVIRDITKRKLAEEQLRQTLDSLRKVFGTTIHVLVSAVETRDPYTAGHQVRAADLARAIATEMGFTKERIDGIRMAGSIHDIGKLSIPAEILSKPTKLTKIEFSLIKEHSQRGYEMLKDVESPWPLAEMVYQHHERMNGAGYPRNLKGDDILMEARILAVADVVESMASHRPYRQARGIDAALEEIEKNKGILYDNTGADACLRLFREKSFQLERT
jgi:PAS domain S-box-containing protein